MPSLISQRGRTAHAHSTRADRPARTARWRRRRGLPFAHSYLLGPLPKGRVYARRRTSTTARCQAKRCAQRAMTPTTDATRQRLAASERQRSEAAGRRPSVRRRGPASVEHPPCSPLVLDQIFDVDAQHERTVDELTEVDVPRSLVALQPPVARHGHAGQPRHVVLSVPAFKTHTRELRVARAQRPPALADSGAHAPTLTDSARARRRALPAANHAARTTPLRRVKSVKSDRSELTGQNRIASRSAAAFSLLMTSPITRTAAANQTRELAGRRADTTDLPAVRTSRNPEVSA